jgi:hypothetical protein
MVTEALFVRMQSTAGQYSEVVSFLGATLSFVQEVPAEAACFDIRPRSLIFHTDTFPDDPGTQAQLSNRVAAVLMAMAAELLTRPSAVERVDVPYARPRWHGEPSFELSRVSLDRPPPGCKRRRTEDHEQWLQSAGAGAGATAMRERFTTSR